jgi:hypothetical protein
MTGCDTLIARHEIQFAAPIQEIKSFAGVTGLTGLAEASGFASYFLFLVEVPLPISARA